MFNVTLKGNLKTRVDSDSLPKAITKLQKESGQDPENIISISEVKERMKAA